MPELVRFHQSKRPTERHITTLLTPEGDLTVSEKPKSTKGLVMSTRHRTDAAGKGRAEPDDEDQESSMFEGVRGELRGHC